MAHPILTKIDNSDLRDFAEGLHPGHSQSVIIELASRPKVKLSKAPSSFKPGLSRGILLSSSNLDEAGHAQAMDDLEVQLNSLGLAKQLVRLDSAQAFVASVTPEQLSAVAKLSAVEIIRPNRSHHATS